jgi:hypothetical protein
MKPHLTNIKSILTLLLFSMAALSSAQTAPQKPGLKKLADMPASALLNPVPAPYLTPPVTDQQNPLAFKKGDGYQRTTVVNSNTVLQRGNQKFDISSRSSVTKNYHVTEASNAGFVVVVTTKRIADTLFAMGKSMTYNSDSKSDTGSFIQKRLGAMVGQTAYVRLNKRDSIYEISGAGNPPVNDTLFAFTGLQPNQLVKGGSLELTTDYAAIQTMKTGYTWADSIHNASTQIKNTFWIQAKGAATTTIAFESAQRQANTNSNTNGVYVIDNATGVVLTRQMQSITTGYQILNNVVYAASRRTAFTESVYKIQ